MRFSRSKEPGKAASPLFCECPLAAVLQMQLSLSVCMSDIGSDLGNQGLKGRDESVTDEDDTDEDDVQVGPRFHNMPPPPPPPPPRSLAPVASSCLCHCLELHTLQAQFATHLKWFSQKFGNSKPVQKQLMP